MATPDRPRAIIYIPGTDDLDRLTALCLTYCDQRGYTVVSLITGDRGGRKWRDACDMLFARNAEVLVAPRRAYLPPGRVPRVEIVDEQYPRRVPRQRRGRPRFTDR